MTIELDGHTAVVHGWGDDPMSAVDYALERVPNMVENGWEVQSISHAFGRDHGAEPGDPYRYSAVVMLRRQRHEAS
ncbi:unannotated protein [freshwater metagenome]|uniref:Unannotated protein n=1 Tax=freshwater metagenome TaxID=449393 RepID=A0A6J7KQ76_9ZZZZ|nr:hypothetical protein [Actinomycetota bacterium]